jgi:hypothetical protein
VSNKENRCERETKMVAGSSPVRDKQHERGASDLARKRLKWTNPEASVYSCKPVLVRRLHPPASQSCNGMKL